MTEKNKSPKWMGVQTVELYRRELRAMFKPLLDEIRSDMEEATEVIEDKAWELLGEEAYIAWKRKKELEKELSGIEEILRKYNGDSCIYRTNYSYNSPSKKSHTELGEALWQAQQLLFGELDELEVMEREAIREITFCESPSDVKSLASSVAQDLDKFIRKYREKRI